MKRRLDALAQQAAWLLLVVLRGLLGAAQQPGSLHATSCSNVFKQKITNMDPDFHACLCCRGGWGRFHCDNVRCVKH